MNVLALTIFVGFVLVGLFVLLFVLQHCAGHGSSEADALLPLCDDDPRPQPSTSTSSVQSIHDHFSHR